LDRGELGARPVFIAFFGHAKAAGEVPGVVCVVLPIFPMAGKKVSKTIAFQRRGISMQLERDGGNVQKLSVHYVRGLYQKGIVSRVSQAVG
jgi:hypothetical protein